MDYKKLIKSRALRVKLLKLLDFIPDKVMIKLQYKIKFNRKLDLKNPKRFTEKLQWYKLYYHDPVMTQCAGKHDSREYVCNKGLGNILNEQYGVYKKTEEIDFNTLPDKFVIKATVGAASQQVFVCTDKSKVNWNELKEKIDGWMYENPDKPRKNAGREWAYNNIKQRLVVEKYIDSSSCANGLLSYKIFCFNGKAKFLYVIADVKDGFFDAGYGIYSTDFERLPYNRVGEVALELTDGKPDNFKEMISIAEKLAEGLPHVRVDLYNVQGEIIFGEMTFYNDSGYMKYDPDEFDFIAGDMFELPQKKV